MSAVPRYLLHSHGHKSQKEHFCCWTQHDKRAVLQQRHELETNHRNPPWQDSNSIPNLNPNNIHNTKFALNDGPLKTHFEAVTMDCKMQMHARMCSCPCPSIAKLRPNLLHANVIVPKCFHIPIHSLIGPFEKATLGGMKTVWVWFRWWPPPGCLDGNCVFARPLRKMSTKSQEKSWWRQKPSRHRLLRLRQELPASKDKHHTHLVRLQGVRAGFLFCLQASGRASRAEKIRTFPSRLTRYLFKS